MLNNYTRTAWRSLTKNRVFTFINVLGLCAGIAAFLFITIYVRFERSYEEYNPNADNVWRITLDLYNGSEFVVTDCETHAPAPSLMKLKYPEVVDYVRMFNNDGLRNIRVGEDKYLESGMYFADPSVFEIFAVNLLQGDPKKALNDPYALVLSESQAKKFFGKTDVVGETMYIDAGLYNITGVFADRPANTHLKFGMLLSHPTLLKLRDGYTEDNWDGNNEYAYLLMKPGTDLAEFNQKLDAFSNEYKEKMPESKYRAEEIKTIHLYSNKSFEPEANGDAKTVSILFIIAVFIIVIAWVNYMNLSTARAVERAKEVGIRKVMGSMKAQLVIQFLSESLIVNIIAGIIAVTAVQTAMPLFRELTGVAALEIDNFFWVLVAGIIFVGAMLAGIYPAFVLSSFKPVSVLKGKFQSSSHGQLLRKTLVVFQFATTIILITGVSVVYLQVNHLRSVDLGTNLDQSVSVRMPRIEGSDSLFRERYLSLKGEVVRDPTVVSTAISGGTPGMSISEMNTSRWQLAGQTSESGRYTYYWHFVDEDFIKTMGMKVIAGRDFEGSNEYGNILVNETTASALGFEKPEDAVGARLNWNWSETKTATIIGVIKNFYQRSPKEEHLPVMYLYLPRGGTFTAHFNTTDMNASVDNLKKAWEKVFPGEIFSYSFLDEKFDQQYRSDIQFGQVVGTFSVLAVIIACLGLFGLSSYTILQRRKEIGIRKVLGASISQVVTLLSGSYLKIVLIASVLALPIAWYAINNWLSGYTVRIDLTLWMFLVPVITILVTALITVSFQTVRSALVNPAISLKDE